MSYKKLKPDEIKTGMKVNYHPVIGGVTAERGYTVDSEPFQSDSGGWVVFLKKKSGYVSIDALSKS